MVLAGGIGFLAAQQGFSSVHPIVSIVSIILIALPSFQGLIKSIGLRKGMVALCFLGLFALSVEALGVSSGFPYGAFHYTGDLGWKVFGLVPWTVPFAWIPLLLGSIVFARAYVQGTIQQSVFAAFILTTMDLVLDPGAVSVGLWTYTFPGTYSGVPWTNFAGWMLVGIATSLTLLRYLHTKQFASELLISAMWMVAFWTGVAGARLLVVPFLIGGFLSFLFVVRFVRGLAIDSTGNEKSA